MICSLHSKRSSSFIIVKDKLSKNLQNLSISIRLIKDWLKKAYAAADTNLLMSLFKQIYSKKLPLAYQSI